MSVSRSGSAPARMITMLVIYGLVLLASGTIAFAPVAANRATTATVSTVITPDFPTGITFSVRIPIEPADAVDSIALYYRINSDDTLNLATVPATNITADDAGINVTLFVNFQTAFVPPGVSLTYFWELSHDGRVVLQTDDEVTLWMDTRFDWETRSSDQITIYTYGISDGFAQWMLDQSQATLDDLEQRYGLDQLDPLAIWIYPNAKDFAGTRQSNTREAIAGLSYPGSSLIAAVIPGGNQREFGRVIPHEISHQALFHATENPFAFPPLWLDEGLATHYQTGGTDHYAGMVWRAQNQGTLFDIMSLNASFPFQPAQATLAYASSWSIVDYIETTYGPAGISRLIDAFSEGRPVEDAVEQALDISSNQLNDDWHQWIVDQGQPDDAAA